MWNRLNVLLADVWNRILTGVINFLPGLIALLLILLLTIALAVVVRILLRRFLRGVKFDTVIANWGFPELASWSPENSPTLLVVRVVFWSVLLMGLMIGVSALDAALPSVLAARVFSYVPNVLAALFVLVVGTVAARFLSRTVLISAVNLRIQSARLVSLGVKWLIVVLTFAMALEHLGIGGPLVTISFGILFGGIVLTLALAVGLGSKEMVQKSWEQNNLEEERQERYQHM